jgi:hypothetical protein
MKRAYRRRCCCLSARSRGALSIDSCTISIFNHPCVPCVFHKQTFWSCVANVTCCQVVRICRCELPERKDHTEPHDFDRFALVASDGCFTSLLLCWYTLLSSLPSTPVLIFRAGRPLGLLGCIAPGVHGLERRCWHDIMGLRSASSLPLDSCTTVPT